MLGVVVSRTLEIRCVCLVFLVLYFLFHVLCFVFCVLCGVLSCLVLCPESGVRSHKPQNLKFGTQDSGIQDSELRTLCVGVRTGDF
jgi:hypothetical protein